MASVGDIEQLRDHLEIGSWVVFGGSWGSSLSLIYAQEHPDRVEHLVLRGIFLCRRSEFEWFYQEEPVMCSLMRSSRIGTTSRRVNEVTSWRPITVGSPPTTP